MMYKQLSTGLGWFSLALGAAEMLASRRIAKALDAEGTEGVIKAFGAREIAAGVGILQAPAHNARVWNRVAGDALDLGALGLAAANSPRNKAVWGAIGFVIGATVLDAWVASKLPIGSAAPQAA
jgi:hypothetical protein